MSNRHSIAAAFVLLVVAHTASADPIVLTGTATRTFSSLQVNLTSPGFSWVGSIDATLTANPSWICHTGCASANFTTDRFPIFGSDVYGIFTIDGLLYPAWRSTGGFPTTGDGFTTVNVQVAGGVLPATADGPLTRSGHVSLDGTFRHQAFGPYTFQADGTAEIAFVPCGGGCYGGPWSLTSMTVTFDQVAIPEPDAPTIPEPATISLLGLGLIITRRLVRRAQ